MRVKQRFAAASASAIVMLAASAQVSFADPQTETASAGPVTAQLSYDRQPTYFSDLRVTILRSGTVAYASSLYDKTCVDAGGPGNYCHPANSYNNVNSVSVRDLDGDGEPEVTVDLRLGGAHDLCYSIIYGYTPPSYTPLKVEFGDPCYAIRKLDSSNHLELVTADKRVGTEFSCEGCSTGALLIYRYSHGRLLNATREFPALLQNAAARAWALYQQWKRKPDAGLGHIADWTADEYLLGRRSAALTTLHRLAHQGFLALPPNPYYNPPGGERFIAALDRYLRSLGYVQAPPSKAAFVIDGIGDSVAAGFGLDTGRLQNIGCAGQMPTSQCDDTADAYPSVLKTLITVADTNGLPVRGANYAMSGTVPSGWLGEAGARHDELRARLERVIKNNPDLITISLGANDVLAYPLCVAWSRKCGVGKLNQAKTKETIRKLLRMLVDRTSADIALVAYYESKADAHHIVPEINATLRAAAQGLDRVFVVTPSFADHGCGSIFMPSWMNGFDRDLCTHPNKLGQRAIADVVSATWGTWIYRHCRAPFKNGTLVGFVTSTKGIACRPAAEVAASNHIFVRGHTTDGYTCQSTGMLSVPWRGWFGERCTNRWRVFNVALGGL